MARRFTPQIAVVPPRTFFKDEPFMGYDTSISSVVEKHGWQIFCLHLKDVLTKLFREFSAHITVPNNTLYMFEESRCCLMGWTRLGKGARMNGHFLGLYGEERCCPKALPSKELHQTHAYIP
ncbi:hypothetical protein PVK06_002053 [Gossypium arboreum]|uniref:Uncharacterized protein n=1 Tax=Gossypium arboreum TaxID=29729 RepID=A0ABR0R3M8_GOSAR|nr:hypothetical protein PVK06_002053 [Gossypium arboreum]